MDFGTGSAFGAISGQRLLILTLLYRDSPRETLFCTHATSTKFFFKDSTFVQQCLVLRDTTRDGSVDENPLTVFFLQVSKLFFLCIAFAADLDGLSAHCRRYIWCDRLPILS